MDRFVNNNDFDKDVIINKLAELSSKLEEERSKEERDYVKERELIYAQFIEGIKLNTISSGRNYFFR